MADLGFRSGGLRFTVTGDALVVSRKGARLATFRVAPAIEGETTRLGAWSRRSADHLAAPVQGRDLSVHLALDRGTVCLWVETGIAQFDRLDYLTDGYIRGDGWQTFVSDVFDRFHDLDVDVEVPISSCFNGLTPDRADGAGMTDPGDHPPTWIWNIPIRAFALHTDHAWLGLSLPGPLAVGVTRLAMRDRAFSLRFEHLRATCRGGTMPRLYFLPGLEGPYDALEAHRDLSARLGWMVERTPDHPAWWAYPTFKPAVDVFATGQKAVLTKNEQGAWVSVFTTDTFRSWVDGFMRQSRLEQGARVLLDQIFMYGYGSRRILRELGGVEGFRRLIDEMQARDIRVGLYFHPYFIGSEEPFAVEHPECFCRPKDPSVAIQWCDMDTLAPAYVDWTHPLARGILSILVDEGIPFPFDSYAASPS